MILALAVVIVVAVVAFVAGVRARDVPPPEPPSPTAHLEEHKARIYDNLRDLQFEYRVGKLSDEDYQRTKLGLQTELAGLLAEIDRVRGGDAGPAAAPSEPPPVPPPPSGGQICPHCGAKFAQPLKFCGECGRSMHVETGS